MVPRDRVQVKCSLPMLGAMLAALVVPPAAAAAPAITLTGELGTATLAPNGGCTSRPGSEAGSALVVCADPPVPEHLPQLPVLAVTPGEVITATVDASWTGPPSGHLTAPGMSVPFVLGMTATGALTYRFTLPARLGPVSHAILFGTWRSGPEGGDAVYFARLRAALPATVGKRVSLTRSGHVRWTVECPEGAGVDCAGIATLRTRRSRRTVARESFEKLAPGKRRTFKSQVSASALRRLQRHPRSALRAVVRRAGGAEPASTTLLRLR